jgi:type IV pilus assembly protein PilB
MSDPTNMRVIDIVKFKAQMDIDVVMASEKDVTAAIERLYAERVSADETLSSLLSASDDKDELETVERDGYNQEPELSDEEGQQVVMIVTTLIL